MEMSTKKVKTNGDGHSGEKMKTNGDGHSGKKVKTNGDGHSGKKVKTNGDGHSGSAKEYTNRDEYLGSADDDTTEHPSVTRRGSGSRSKVTAKQSVEVHSLIDDKLKRNEKKTKLLRFTIFVLVVVILVLLIAVICLSVDASGNATPMTLHCNAKDGDNIRARDFDNPGIFDDLTPNELNAVNKFMLSKKSLGIKSWDKARVNSSYILMIDLFLPKKKTALKYLDKSGEQPERQALVTVVHGDTDTPCVKEYLVSPLPQPKTAKLYINPAYRRTPIPYTSRPMDLIDYKFLFPGLIYPITESLYPLLMDSYGRCYHNCTKGVNCLEVFDVSPRGTKSGDRKSWLWFFPSVEGYYMHPLGLEMLINHASTDVDKWFVETIVYNGQKFASVDALMTTYKSKSFKLLHIHDHKKEPTFSSYEIKGDLPETPQQGPKLMEPEGKRFTVTGQHVTYQKWQFDFHTRPTSGLQIFNLNFDGSRIAYELSLQEVLVFYTGYGPAQSSTNYYDVSWFLGASSMELVRGVDCPDTAVFLYTYFWANAGKVEKFKNNICIFENNGAIPLRRHYANNFHGGYDFYGGIPDYHLVVRTIVNIWNYDYVFDYLFYANGAVQVKASATGYVQAAFRLPEEDSRYGGVLRDTVMADLHQHIFNYKVDLDIGGDKNRYSTLDIGLHSVDNKWTDGPTKGHMIISKNLINQESSNLPVDQSIPKYHIIHNPNSKNGVGADKAYRILNKSPVPYIMAQESVAAAAKWANYPIIVTKRKDTELDSTSIYAQNDPWDPVLDFADYIDNDNLVDEDLVAWVTIGTTHIPGTEDIPSTPTTWNQYSFFLTPHNYFDECPSVQSTDNVIIRPNSKGRDKVSVETFGRSFKSQCVPRSVGPFDFDGIRE